MNINTMADIFGLYKKVKRFEEKKECSVSAVSVYIEIFIEMCHNTNSIND